MARFIAYIIALACVCAAGFLYHSHAQATAGLVRTQAQVANLDIRSEAKLNGTVRRNYYPVVSFVAEDGTQQAFTLKEGSPVRQYEVGSKVWLLYAAGEPQEAVIQSGLRSWWPTALSASAALLAIICGVILGCDDKKARKQQQ